MDRFRLRSVAVLVGTVVLLPVLVSGPGCAVGSGADRGRPDAGPDDERLGTVARRAQQEQRGRSSTSSLVAVTPEEWLDGGDSVAVAGLRPGASIEPSAIRAPQRAAALRALQGGGGQDIGEEDEEDEEYEDEGDLESLEEEYEYEDEDELEDELEDEEMDEDEFEDEFEDEELDEDELEELDEEDELEDEELDEDDELEDEELDEDDELEDEELDEDDGEEAFGVEETPRRPIRRQPRAGRAVRPEEVLSELALDHQARKAEAVALVRQARDLRLAGELQRAELLLETAQKLDPQNQAGELALAEVRHLLGDRRGEVRNAAGHFFAQEKLAREVTRTEIRRSLTEGLDRERLGEYDRAIDLFKRAIDMSRSEPFDLQLDEELRSAELALARAEQKQAESEERERQAVREMIEQTKRTDLDNNLEYLMNQLRELHRRAHAAMENKNYDRAATIYSQILKLNSRDRVAQSKFREAKERGHLHAKAERMREAVSNYELAVIGVEESSIVYQQIFRYPDREVWQRISPKIISIEEQVSQTQSLVDKEVRRKLELPQSIEFPVEISLREALAELHTLTDLNFFIKPGEDGGIEDTPVRLDPVENLSIRKILELLLEQADGDVEYVVREGAVHVGPEDGLQEDKFYWSYEISDLIRARPNFNAPDLALDELAGQDTGGSIDIDIGDDEEDQRSTAIGTEDLLQIIGEELSGESEGEPEGIQIYGGKLNALVSLQDHLALAKSLDRFRKAGGMMVTVESRFLDIEDNFLEEIGINFGGTTSNLPNTIPDADGTGTALAPGYEFVDARGEFNLRAASIGGLSNPLGSQVNPFNLSSTGGGAYQLNVLDSERFQLEAILTGVSKTQEIRRLNSPRVTAFNTQTSHTLVVEQAAYIQDLEVNQTGVIPVINPVIGVLNTGSILELRPTISHDRKYVVLEVQPTLAEEIARDVAVLNLSGSLTVVPVDLPVLSVTKIKTTVTVPDGGTVLVGGLKREIHVESSVGMPFLRHIPLLNLIFGKKGKSTLRSNLFVLINAKITVVHEEEAKLLGSGI